MSLSDGLGNWFSLRCYDVIMIWDRTTWDPTYYLVALFSGCRSKRDVRLCGDSEMLKRSHGSIRYRGYPLRVCSWDMIVDTATKACFPNRAVNSSITGNGQGGLWFCAEGSGSTREEAFCLSILHNLL